MKKLKKVASLFAASTLLLSMAACGGADATGGTEGSESGDKIEIEYWHINSETFAGPTVTEIVEDFNASQDRIVVTEKFASNYMAIMQDLQADAAAGTSPDLVQIGWSYLEYFGNNFGYTDANELFATYGGEENANFVNDTFEESVSSLAIHSNGDMLGTAYGMSVPVMFMNTEILEEAGVNPDDIKTWADVDEAARKISESTDKYGIYIGEYTYVWEMQQMVESNGGSYITDGKSSIDSPEAVEAIELYANLVNDDVALHVVSDEGKRAYLAGEVGIYMDSVAYANLVLSSDVVSEVIIAPSWEGEELKLPIGGNFLAITSATEEKKEATAEFLTFMYASENMLKWNGATGYIPPIKSAAESDFMTENPVTKMAYDNLGSAVPWAAFPGNDGLQAEQLMIALRDEVLAGEDVQTAVSKAQEEINKLYE